MKPITDGHQLTSSESLFEKAPKIQDGPCSIEATEKIRNAIRKKFRGVSATATGYFKYPVGRKGTEILGYDKSTLQHIPEELLLSFCGVGNPFSIEPVAQNSILLDIGCGTGVDLLIASKLVGKKGSVIGVDLTQEMIEKARENLAIMKVENAEALVISSENLPFADNHFDIVISNGVINLSPNKQELFEEIHRVLKPGGRLQFADIILNKKLPEHMTTSAESWSQ